MHPVLFHIGAFIIPSYGAVVALGVLAGLFLAQRTARTAGLNVGHIWNLCVVALFTALVAQRLLLIVVNAGQLHRHPSWMFMLAMVHHPLLAGVGAAAGLASAAIYARLRRLPSLRTADVLAAPVALGMAFEQFGALLAGSDYGTDAQVPWAVTYSHPLAAIWSGTPLGVPLHPVQAYAAVAFLTLAVFLLVWQPATDRSGDLTGMWLMGTGIIIYITELWRDPAGRGVILDGALDGPQIAAILMVIGSAFLLYERKEKRATGENTHG